MAIIVPVLPVTAYTDIDKIKQTPIKMNADAKQMFDEIMEYTNIVRD